MTPALVPQRAPLLPPQRDPSRPHVRDEAAPVSPQRKPTGGERPAGVEHRGLDVGIAGPYQGVGYGLQVPGQGARQEGADGIFSTSVRHDED